MNSRSLCCALFSGILAMVTLNACGPQEKPAELVQLEEMRRNYDSAAINDLAPEAYKKCSDLTYKALDSWQDGEQEQAKLYAELGQRQYITAQAKYDFQKADVRRQAAQKAYNDMNAQMDSMRAQVTSLNASILETKKKIADADPNNSELRIQLAMAERDKAVSVDAPQSQKDIFNAADAKLNEASNYNVKGKRKEASARAEEARVMFVKAYEMAKPDFDKRQANAAASERLKALVSDAQSIFGASNVVTTDARETIIVVSGSFDKNSDELHSDSMDVLKKVVDLFKRYPEATARVEGHAQKDSKNAQSIAQKRADASVSFLAGQGLDKSRMTSVSKGKSFLRFDEKKKENKALNDRVEIVIVMP